jgi:hypothetical protein
MMTMLCAVQFASFRRLESKEIESFLVDCTPLLCLALLVTLDRQDSIPIEKPTFLYTRTIQGNTSSCGTIVVVLSCLVLSCQLEDETKRRMARSNKNQPSSRHGKKSQQHTPKVAVAPPNVASKREKYRQETKKQLLRQEKHHQQHDQNNSNKKRKERHRDRHRTDDEKMMTTTNARNSSLFGPLNVKKKKSDPNQQQHVKKDKDSSKKKTKRDVTEDESSRKQRRSNKSSNKSHHSNITVIMDGAPLHHHAARQQGNHHHQQRSPRSYNSNHSKMPPFQLQTIVNPKGSACPWWTETERQNWFEESHKRRRQQPSQSSQSRKNHYLFGTQVPHEEWLSQLDAELMAFATFVQLSPQERQARQFIVNTVESVARTNLDCTKSKLYNNKDNNTTPRKIQVQVFGSFATPPVCAFCSDVDMALYGLVPIDNDEEDNDNDNDTKDKLPKGNHTRFDSSPTTSTTNTNTKKRRDKWDKVQKWKDLLEECDQQQQQQQQMEQQTVASQREQDAKEKNVQESPGVQDHDDDNHDNSKESGGDGEVAWQNALDEFLTGANEGPDSFHDHDHEDPPDHDAVHDGIHETQLSSKNRKHTPQEEDDGAVDNLSSKNLDQPQEARTSSSQSKPQQPPAQITNEHSESTKDAIVAVVDPISSFDDQHNLVTKTTPANKDNNSSKKDLPDNMAKCSDSQAGSRDESAVVAFGDEEVKDCEAPARAIRETLVSDNFFVVDRIGMDEPQAQQDEEEEERLGADDDDEAIKAEEDEALDAALLATLVDDPVTKSSRKRSFSETMMNSDSDSEDDTADKLASLHARKPSPNKDVVRQQPDSEQAVISLSSDDEEDEDNDEEEDDLEDDDDMHVSFVANPPPSVTKSMGPSGAVRAEVINVLSNLGSILRKRHFTQSIQVIRKARVPIVTFQTKMGFEGDVAVGGHSGTDTSQFAMTQVERFQRYACTFDA